MANMNLLVALNTYSDKNASNHPSLQNFKWDRDVVGFQATNPASLSLTIPASGSVTVFTSAAKKFIYIESSDDANLTINGAAAPILIKPFVINTLKNPSMFMLKADMASLVIANPSTTAAITVFVVHSE